MVVEGLLRVDHVGSVWRSWGLVRVDHVGSIWRSWGLVRVDHVVSVWRSWGGDIGGAGVDLDGLCSKFYQLFFSFILLFSHIFPFILCIFLFNVAIFLNIIPTASSYKQLVD